MYNVIEIVVILAALGLAVWYLLRRFLRTKRSLEQGTGCGCGCGDSCPAAGKDRIDE